MIGVKEMETQGKVVLTTKEGWKIKAHKIVFAVGYEAKHYLGKTPLLKAPMRASQSRSRKLNHVRRTRHRL